MELKLYKFLGILFLSLIPVKAAQVWNDSGQQLISLNVISQLSDEEEHVKVPIDERSTVRNLKELLAYEIGFMPNYHKLYTKQGPLDQEKATLFSCGLQDGTLVYAREISKGLPSFNSTIFADGTNYKDSTLETATKDTPVWDIVCKGFSYLGVCRNKNCKANDKEVLIHRGINMTIDVADEIIDEEVCICPGCKEYVPEIKSWGAYKCKYVIKGKILDKARSSKTTKRYKKYQKEGKANEWRYFFEDKEGKGMSEFGSLKITVSDL